VFYLLLCPSCKHVLSYHFTGAKRPRKKCVYCNRKFDITRKVILNEFDNSKECVQANKILSQHYPNDHLHKYTHKQLLEKFRELLKNAVLDRQEDFINKNGHRASPHDQMTNSFLDIRSLSELGVELDRVHFSFILENLYWSFDSVPANYSPKRFELEYGTILVHSSGVVDCYIDLSDETYLAQVEGLLYYFIKKSGHHGHLKIRLHDHEFTIRAPEETELARRIEETLGKNTKVAFIEQTVKVYHREGDHWRIEAQSIGDAINVATQMWNRQLGQPGINVLAYGYNNNGEITALQQQLQIVDNKIDQQSNKLDLQSQATTELIYAFENLKAQNELDTERLREEISKTYSKLSEFEDKLSYNFSFRKSIFDIRCETILELLNEHEYLEQTELANLLQIKQQGIKRYLDTLLDLGLIQEGKKIIGRGRPKKVYRLLQQGEILPNIHTTVFGKIIWEEESGEEKTEQNKGERNGKKN